MATRGMEGLARGEGIWMQMTYGVHASWFGCLEIVFATAGSCRRYMTGMCRMSGMENRAPDNFWRRCSVMPRVSRAH